LGFSSWIKVWMKINSRRPLSRTRAEGADQFAWTIPTLYRVCVSSRGTPDRYTELLLDHIGSHHNLIWLGAATGDADGADAGRPPDPPPAAVGRANRLRRARRVRLKAGTVERLTAIKAADTGS
jgi:hypothetical protein